ncbi:hypothetical protein [Streptomyces sp. t39]|uniref:hypothetical protein n=1 Tax=Streptomyces sp. t39 TaxID=1828156 RepID=UPI0011CDFE08|nr:hypothetical protein [Streptomyces sp. t39]TXS56223.1 hypothetical protein EAO77_08915 [Streptomyces sp. t39]
MLKPVRTSAVTAGLVAVLALTGCAGGDDGGDKGKASASPTASGDGTGGETQKPLDVEGTWAGLTDAKPVVLSVKDGKAALLADGHACTGEVEDHGSPMLALKCADGNTDRTMGAIESNDGTTLVISWDAGKKDTLKKNDGASLPEGLPTALPTS